MTPVSKRKRSIGYVRPKKVLQCLLSAVILTSVIAQEEPDFIKLEARFSLMGKVEADYLTANINVVTLPEETQVKSLGLFWKAAELTEESVFFSGPGLSLQGYQLDYADGQILQMHMTLEPTSSRPILYGALLGATGRLNLEDYPEPKLGEDTVINFSSQFIEDDSEGRGSLIFSFVDEQGEAFIGAGLVLASEPLGDLQMDTGTAEAFSLQDGPSSGSRYASFNLRLSNEQQFKVLLALIMPERIFKSVSE